MHAIILSGGVGSRLWPVSRELYPKPFIRLSDNQSFLQKVLIRCMNIQTIKSITNVTNSQFLFKVKDEYNEIIDEQEKDFDINYLLEPFGRNTAAAIAAVTLYIVELYGENSTLLVLPSDHIISDQQAFNTAILEAESLTKQGKIVVFGIKPNKPETGYGYIESLNTYQVSRFVEKPSQEQAEIYLNSGNFLWNSGIFCFSAKIMLQEMVQHCPDILESVKYCINNSRTLKGKKVHQLNIDAISFSKVREESIDYAVMEKSSNLAVVSCNIGWKDVGTWNAMSELENSDNLGNIINGETVLHNVTNCYISSSTRVVGAVGIDNLLVIDTPDALLIANKDSAQDVKSVYAQLKYNQHEAHKLHKTVHRPWGTYTILEESSKFKIKRIEINPNASLSLQLHKYRSEHWVVVNGQARVINGDQEIILNVNESTYIPAGAKHRLSNMSFKEKLVIIEIQTGNYLGEDDIVRFDDIYGRVANV
ncbi:Alginate biosynthesis protein AlgA [Rickettsiales bacterium Ac37b]|nr:Alginate biosynthesis protein AlgA [Rickettsiales bacterium Ac37b]